MRGWGNGGVGGGEGGGGGWDAGASRNMGGMQDGGGMKGVWKPVRGSGIWNPGELRNVGMWGYGQDRGGGGGGGQGGCRGMGEGVRSAFRCRSRRGGAGEFRGHLSHQGTCVCVEFKTIKINAKHLLINALPPKTRLRERDEGRPVRSVGSCLYLKC